MQYRWTTPQSHTPDVESVNYTVFLLCGVVLIDGVQLING